MAKAKLVLATNVKYDGKIIEKGTEITPDHDGYDHLKKYLVDESALNSRKGKAVRVLDSVRSEDTEEDDGTPSAAVDEEDAVKVEDTRTKADLKAELDAKGITYNPNANKADLLALVNA